MTTGGELRKEEQRYTKSFGLLGMKERAIMLGGHVRIPSTADNALRCRFESQSRSSNARGFRRFSLIQTVKDGLHIEQGQGDLLSGPIRVHPRFRGINVSMNGVNTGNLIVGWPEGL